MSHDHSQCLVNAAGYETCNAPEIQHRIEQREVYALNNGATAQTARDFAIESNQPPTLKEYCDFLISHLS
jgi:hypothetical protein